MSYRPLAPTDPHGELTTYRRGCRCAECRAQNAAATRDYKAGVRRPLGTMEERFWAKVDRTDQGCWLWTGALSVGYGSFSAQWPAPPQLAHRIAYELLVGPIPEGLTLDHLCRVTRCVNPAHLEAVTMRVNVLRSTSFAAVNARKTHCHRGHPFDEENTYVRPDNGGRQCRRCCQIRARRLAG